MVTASICNLRISRAPLARTCFLFTQYLKRTSEYAYQQDLNCASKRTKCRSDTHPQETWNKQHQCYITTVNQKKISVTFYPDQQ